MAYHLGIDLGTTYTAAAAERSGVVEALTLGNRTASVPSVVYLRDDGEILVGEAATRRATSDPGRVAREFKRRVGDPTPIILGGTPYAAEMLMARMLRWSVDRVQEQQGEQPRAIALTHPANWGPYKLDLLRQAVRQVDLDAALMLAEPVAAATFYASQRRLEPGSVVAVYDLGGGTFDAAMVRRKAEGFEAIGTPEGIERLGGIDFDEAVFAHVREAVQTGLDRLDPEEPAAQAAVARLRQECIDAKEALSSDTDVSIPVLLPGLQTEVRLTRTEFEAMIRPAVSETIVALRRAIRSARVADDEISAVLLVGGSSRIPLVAQMVGAELGRPIAIDAHPKDAIAFGAAIAVAARQGSATPESVTTVLADHRPPPPTQSLDASGRVARPAPPPGVARPAPPSPARPAPPPAARPAPPPGAVRPTQPGPGGPGAPVAPARPVPPAHPTGPRGPTSPVGPGGPGQAGAPARPAPPGAPVRPAAAAGAAALGGAAASSRATPTDGRPGVSDAPAAHRAPPAGTAPGQPPRPAPSSPTGAAGPPPGASPAPRSTPTPSGPGSPSARAAGGPASPGPATHARPTSAPTGPARPGGGPSGAGPSGPGAPRPPASPPRPGAQGIPSGERPAVSPGPASGAYPAAPAGAPRPLATPPPATPFGGTPRAGGPQFGGHTSGSHLPASSTGGSLAENKAVWVVLGVVALIAVIVIVVALSSGGGDESGGGDVETGGGSAEQAGGDADGGEAGATRRRRQRQPARRLQRRDRGGVRRQLRRQLVRAGVPVRLGPDRRRHPVRRVHGDGSAGARGSRPADRSRGLRRRVPRPGGDHDGVRGLVELTPSGGRQPAVATPSAAG